MKPYYADERVTLYHGDMREVIQDFAEAEWCDACITDPPYGETALAWDQWVERWPLYVRPHTEVIWCFGSMRMFTDHWGDFAGWRLAQDVVWEKHNGSGFAADRFKRVHELAVQLYAADVRWTDLHHDTPREPRGMANQASSHGGRDTQRCHTGDIGEADYTATNTRLVRSVIRANSMNGRAIHPTEKPAAVLDPLIRYSVPVGGQVLDPFAGSGSTLLTARSLGRRAIGIEADERYCEAAARRLDEPDLFGGAA